MSYKRLENLSNQVFKRVLYLFHLCTILADQVKPPINLIGDSSPVLNLPLACDCVQSAANNKDKNSVISTFKLNPVCTSLSL